MGNQLVGNAVIGQSGGPTSVINQSLVGVVLEAKKAGHIKELFGAQQATDAGALSQRSNIVHATEVKARSQAWEFQRLGRGRLAPPRLVEVRGGLQLER